MNKRKWAFPVALGVYALVFLIALAVGISWLWGYMEDFENSRPDGVLEEYKNSITAQYVADRCGDLALSIDPNVQSEAQCRQILLSVLEGNFSFAKKSKESDENRHVYAIRCGSQIIGTMTMERSGEMAGNFQKWVVTKETFDLSFLPSEPVSITVPEDYRVYSHGNLLSKDYITRDKIPYELMKGLYEDYTLPHMVTYTVGPVLGESALTVTDPEGNTVTIDEKTDMTVFLNNCTEAQIAAGDAHAKAFIQRYVDFMSCTGGNIWGNLDALSAYIVPGGELAQRMLNTIEGLTWITDRGAKISSITVVNRHAMEDGRYFWDVSYVVDTKDFTGSIQTQNRVKLILTEMNGGLKTEMIKNG